MSLKLSDVVITISSIFGNATTSSDNVNDISRILIEIHEGRNRQVRKMCEAIGLSVIALKRQAVGGITCEGVERGKWRYLTEEEVKAIMNE